MGTSGTNAYLIMAIFAFYTFIVVIAGLAGASIIANNNSLGTPPNPDGIGFLSQISYFFAGIGFTLGGLPIWANTLLFAPLGITVFYIIMSWLRGSS